MTLISTKPMLRNGYLNGRLTEPRMNVLEREDAWLLELAAPGLHKEDFRIETEAGRLRISARKEAEAAQGEEVLRREFGEYDFEKSFKLSDKVKVEGISASYEAGVLRLTLPKAEEAKPRKVAVR